MSRVPSPQEFHLLFEQLETMPYFLKERFAGLPPREVTRRGPEGHFAPVEHCWHLADLEREGFGVRITRMLEEQDPLLPDFDGDRIAEERRYGNRDLREGLAAFERARADNLSLLRTIREEQWSRSGRQEGLGTVSLSDLPRLMREHDDAHRSQIEAWSREKPRASE